MARASWRLHVDLPVVEVVLNPAPTGRRVTRRLLADTGAGTANAPFEVLMDEDDCLRCGGVPAQPVRLGGTYSGAFPRYYIRLEIPQLNTDVGVFAVGLPSVPDDVDGIACFRFLNRLNYGDFGDPGMFGLKS